MTDAIAAIDAAAAAFAGWARTSPRHRGENPVVPSERVAFEVEMDAAEENWRMLTFGGLLRSFCEEEADVLGVAMVDEATARETHRLTNQEEVDSSPRAKTITPFVDAGAPNPATTRVSILRL